VNAPVNVRKVRVRVPARSGGMVEREYSPGVLRAIALVHANLRLRRGGIRIRILSDTGMIVSRRVKRLSDPSLMHR